MNTTTSCLTFPALIRLLAAAALLAACDSPFSTGDGELRLMDTLGQPVAYGLLAYDGGDAGLRTVRAGWDGVVPLPDDALDRAAWILATGVQARAVPTLRRRTYELTPTRQRYAAWAELEGLPLRASDGILYTVDGSGALRRYGYSSGASGLLDFATTFPLGFQVVHHLAGDTLWLLGWRDGAAQASVQAWLLRADSAARPLGYFNVPPAAWILRQDSLVVLGMPDSGTVKVLVAEAGGAHRELATMWTGRTSDAFLFGRYVVAHSVSSPEYHVVVIDLAAPGGPALAGQHDLGSYQIGIPWGDSLLLARAPAHYAMIAVQAGGAPGRIDATAPALPPGGLFGDLHRFVDMSDPAAPVPGEDVWAPAWASAVVPAGPAGAPGARLVLGTAYADWSGIGPNVLMDPDDGWNVVSTFAEAAFPLVGATALVDGDYLFLTDGDTGWAFHYVWPLD